MQDYPDYYRVLKASDGSSVALSSFENKKPVVLAFYPKAATPGCTKQVCAMRDNYSELSKKAAVFGISGDEPATNAAFAAAQNLPFPLLTDASSFLRKSFGVKGDMMGLLPGRQTIVIDKKGKVCGGTGDEAVGGVDCFRGPPPPPLPTPLPAGRQGVQQPAGHSGPHRRRPRGAQSALRRSDGVERRAAPRCLARRPRLQRRRRRPWRGGARERRAATHSCDAASAAQLRRRSFSLVTPRRCPPPCRPPLR